MDHYEVLGISRGASKEEVNAAFRREAKLTHPDLGGSEERFKLILAARKAALADEKHQTSHQVTVSVPVPTHKPHYEPEVRRGPVTVFRTGPSPFPLPRPPFFPSFSFSILNF